MNKIRKNKSALIAISTALIVAGLAMFVVGIILAVKNIDKLISVTSGSSIALIVVGVLLVILGVVAFAVGFTFLWTGLSLKATDGSIAQDNLAMGTVNMTKCAKCGTELKSEAEYCPHCGNPASNQVNCPHCGEPNDTYNQNCTKCGKELR